MRLITGLLILCLLAVSVSAAEKLSDEKAAVLYYSGMLMSNVKCQYGGYSAPEFQSFYSARHYCAMFSGLKGLAKRNSQALRKFALTLGTEHENLRDVILRVSENLISISGGSGDTFYWLDMAKAMYNQLNRSGKKLMRLFEKYSDGDIILADDGYDVFKYAAKVMIKGTVISYSGDYSVFDEYDHFNSIAWLLYNECRNSYELLTEISQMIDDPAFSENLIDLSNHLNLKWGADYNDVGNAGVFKGLANSYSNALMSTGTDLYDELMF